MTHPSIHQTELAAALFDLVGGPVPHPYEQEEEARALAKQLGDRSKVLLKVIELCKTPTTPEQLYLTARAYSFLGGPYAGETERYATAYLSTDGWKGLPQRTVEEEGILINQAAGKPGLHCVRSCGCGGTSRQIGGCNFALFGGIPFGTISGYVCNQGGRWDGPAGTERGGVGVPAATKEKPLLYAGGPSRQMGRGGPQCYVPRIVKRAYFEIRSQVILSSSNVKKRWYYGEIHSTNAFLLKETETSF